VPIPGGEDRLHQRLRGVGRLRDLGGEARHLLLGLVALDVRLEEDPLHDRAQEFAPRAVGGGPLLDLGEDADRGLRQAVGLGLGDLRPEVVARAAAEEREEREDDDRDEYAH
jgi:hypothetical protein